MFPQTLPTARYVVVLQDGTQLSVTSAAPVYDSSSSSIVFKDAAGSEILAVSMAFFRYWFAMDGGVTVGGPNSATTFGGNPAQGPSLATVFGGGK